MKSELDKLRDKENFYKDQIADLEHENKMLEERIYELECDALDTSTLDKQMMFERLSENWHLLTMSDIDAICKI